jgi:RNA polymerase-associated protein LEO1
MGEHSSAQVEQTAAYRWQGTPDDQKQKCRTLTDLVVQVWHWKLPAYMKIDSKPYDAEYYRETLGEDEVLDGSQDPKAARRRMLEVKNTIRWKWVTGPDGEPVSLCRQGSYIGRESV